MPRQVQSLTAAAEERVTDQGVRGRTTPEPAERMGPTQARAEIAERSYRDSPVGGRDTVEGRDTCEPTRRRSEGYSLDEGGVVTGIWREVFRKANPGALVVFLDNGHSDFTTAFDEYGLVKAWSAYTYATGSLSLRGTAKSRPAEVKDYTRRFGRIPKLKSLVSHRVLRKPDERG